MTKQLKRDVYTTILETSKGAGSAALALARICRERDAEIEQLKSIINEIWDVCDSGGGLEYTIQKIIAQGGGP